MSKKVKRNITGGTTLADYPGLVKMMTDKSIDPKSINGASRKKISWTCTCESAGVFEQEIG
jgi:hypothetical protein